MTDQDANDETSHGYEEAFRARFPVKAFIPIALALGKSAEPESLQALREWLLPYFDLFHNSTGKNPSRDKRLKAMIKLRDAATTLLASVAPGSVASMNLSWKTLWAARDRQFKAIVERLANEADEQFNKLSKLGRTGPPVKNAAFRELTPGLVHIYEHLADKAKKPNWRGNSGMYGSDFYDFAVAVWRCLYDCLPEVRRALPRSEGALAQELKNHWPKDRATTG
jgi:hypothetical protein